VHVAPALEVVAPGGFGWAPAIPHEVTDQDRTPLEDAAALARNGESRPRPPCSAATRSMRSLRTRTPLTPT
jgi:hypothetical protein